MMVTRDKFQKLLFLGFFPVAGVSNFISSNIKFTFGKSIFLFYLLICLLFSFKLKKIKNIKSYKPKIIGYSIIIVLFISYLKTFLFDSKLVGITTVFVISFIYLTMFFISKSIATKKISWDFIECLSYSFLIFFGINFFLFVFGFKNPSIEAQYTENLDTVIGIFGDRKAMPLSAGIIDSSVISLFAGIISVFFFRHSGSIEDFSKKILARTFYFFLSSLSFFSILISGSRYCLLIYFFLIVFISFNCHHSKLMVSITCFIFLFFSPLYLVFSKYIFSSEIFYIFEGISRSGDVFDLISINNRLLIWATVFEYLFFNASFKDILLGYGFYGQSISGVVHDYNFLFANSYSNIDKVNVHSSILQILINTGVVGVLVYFLFIFYALKKSILHSKRHFGTIIIVLCVVSTAIEAQMVVESFVIYFMLISGGFLIFLENKEA